MKINSVDSVGYVVSIGKMDNKKPTGPKRNLSQDKLELSGQARELAKPNLSSERLALIKQRIAENFYDQDEVLEEIASRMLKNPEFRKLFNR